MKNQNKSIMLAIICISSILISGAAIYTTLLSVSAQEAEDPYNLLVISKGNDKYFLESLGLDAGTFNVSRISDTELLSDLVNQDLIVVFDANLSSSQILTLETYIDAGGAAVVIMGPFLHENPQLLKDLEIIASTANVALNNETMLPIVNDETHPISSNIDWNSAPALKKSRVSVVQNSDLSEGVHQLIDMYPSDVSFGWEDHTTPLLMKKTKEGGSVSIFMGWLERNDLNTTQNANKPYYVWPYFNYLLYSLAIDGLGETDNIASYADWEYSPVPHGTDRIVIMLVVLGLGVITSLLFVIVRKKMKNNVGQKLEIDVMEASVDGDSSTPSNKVELLRKIETGSREDLKNRWEIIGPHRQLSGFLSYFFLGLIIIIPQILITSFLLPLIMGFSYAQAMGWYGYAARTYTLLWTVFDLGTGVAMVKKIAQYRVSNPEKSMHYVQIFIWWQILTGVVQLLIVAVLGSFVLPKTNLAHMSWIFITFSMIQYPGFFVVYQAALRGFQRIDLYTILQVCWDWVFLLIGQILFCWLGRMWGEAHPVFGAALGASIGLTFANYFRYWMSFGLGMLFFKRAGFSVRKCFQLDFEKSELKEMVTFGSKMTIGSLFGPIVSLIQISIVAIYVADYSSELGYYSLAGTVGEMVQIMWLYALALMGALSQSHAYKKHKLTKLYLYNGFRWMNYFGFFVISTILASGKYFLIGTAGQELGTSAAKYLIYILIVQSLNMYSWVAENYIQGTDRPGLSSILTIIVQVFRLAMLFLLIYTHQLYFVILAFVPGLFVKDLISWIFIYKKTKFRLYFYKSVFTPLVASVINYFILRVVGDLLFQINMGNKIINTGILFVTGMFVLICLYAAIDGFLGGYDGNTIAEYKNSVEMIKMKAIRKIATIVFKSAEFGHKISPLQRKFEIHIFDEAMVEAYQLTLEKKQIRN